MRRRQGATPSSRGALPLALSPGAAPFVTHANLVTFRREVQTRFATWSLLPRVCLTRTTKQLRGSFRHDLQQLASLQRLRVVR